MNRFAVLLTAILTLGSTTSFASPLLVKQIGGAQSDYGAGVAVDGSSNFVAIGDFFATIDCGGGPLTTAGGSDIYLAKYTSTGSHLWSKRLGGGDSESAIGVAIDASNDIYITGWFSGTVNFGGSSLVGAGNRDIVLAKYDSNGNHIWSKRFGGGDNDESVGLEVDASGNVLLTGRFNGTVDFGGGGLSSAGSTDAFIAKYNSSGDHVWSKRYGSTEYDEGLGITSDGSGNVVAAGIFSFTVNFGGGNLTSSGAYDGYVVKLDAAGNHIWSKGWGGPTGDVFYGVDVDGAGDVYAAGTYSNTADFGGGPYPNAGSGDIIVAKYSSVNGNHVWSRHYGGVGLDFANDIEVDAAGNALVTGLCVGPIAFEGTPYNHVGMFDLLLLTFSPDGQLLTSAVYGGPGQDRGQDCMWTGPNQALVTGSFEQTVNFDGDTKTSLGASDAFVLHAFVGTPVIDLGPPTVTAPADAGYQCASQVLAGEAQQATATDDQGVTSLTFEETSNGGAGSPASPLIITRTWTATDAAGNSASDSQTITVVDDILPAVTVPAAIVLTVGPGVESCAEVRVVVEELGTATAVDNCGAAAMGVSGVPEGNRFAVGTTLITYTATDVAGNTATATQAVNVLCPVGTVSGSVNLTCNGSTVAFEGVTARLLHEGTPFRETTTGADGSYAFPEVRLGTYTVQIAAPSGYGVPIDTRVVTLTEENGTPGAEPFAFTCLLSDLTGSVSGTCTGSSSGLQGITVDLFSDAEGGTDVLVATTATDASGHYRFNDLALGEYTLGIVLPLGFNTSSSSQAVTLATPDGSLAAADFGLACLAIVAQPRSMGYWKHQVNVYLTGKGSAQESLADLLHYIDELVAHFNENLVNPVVVYVPGATITSDKLLRLQQLLTVNRGGTALDRAKQQLLALMLNVVSAKISQTQVISGNGATVSQVITHSYDLIVDGFAGNDDDAGSICERVNVGEPVPSGGVPAGTRVITYNLRPGPESPLPTALALGAIAPNPVARAGATISFSLPSDAPATLELVDLSGRRIWREWLSAYGAGRHTIRLTQLGNLRPGIYLMRLAQAGHVTTARLAIIR